ncbi:MAG TPA: 6-pyruvoyl-tetrahydropterin synthase-related protein [Pyrinomonadaceae bacterium]|nr:6-pyruvoyl-tetrahydropterin synthase-related protein [Pyrinomonadaceae bacterium]
MRKFLEFLKRNSEKKWFGFAVAVAMAVATIVLPISLGGIKQTADMESHIHFAQTFRDGISVGDFYPGWANDNLGFGSVGIRFYPPVAAFTSAVFELGTGDWHAAFVSSMFLWMMIGCFGMYLFIREWGSPSLGLFGAVLYAIVPYQIAHIFRFFLYAEFASMAAVPFFLLYLTRLLRYGNWRDVAPLALSSSVLILTHIPVTLMLGFSLLIYVPVAVDLQRWKKILLQLSCAGALAAAATAFYWIKIVTELLWVAHADQSYTVAGYERGPMLFPYLLVDYDISYEIPFLRHLDIISVLTIALLFPAGAVFVSWWKNGKAVGPARVLAAATCTAAFGIFMFSKPSGFLWASVEVLNRLQYPWRWLAVVSAFAVVSLSLSLRFLVEAHLLSKATAVFGSILLIFFFAATDIKQIRGMPYRLSPSAFNELAADVTSQSVATHWWPAWAKADAFQITERVTSEHPRSLEVTEWKSEQRSFSVGEGEAEDLRVATFYYPYWHASVNGREERVGRDENGAITIPVGREASHVVLRFQKPLTNTIASSVSAIAWIFLLGLLASRIALTGVLSHETNDKAAAE